MLENKLALAFLRRVTIPVAATALVSFTPLLLSGLAAMTAEASTAAASGGDAESAMSIDGTVPVTCVASMDLS